MGISFLRTLRSDYGNTPRHSRYSARRDAEVARAGGVDPGVRGSVWVPGDPDAAARAHGSVPAHCRRDIRHRREGDVYFPRPRRAEAPPAPGGDPWRRPRLSRAWHGRIAAAPALVLHRPDGSFRSAPKRPLSHAPSVRGGTA